jgi:hypothetical protein
LNPWRAWSLWLDRRVHLWWSWCLCLSRGWLGPWWRWNLYLGRWLSLWWTYVLKDRDIHRLIYQCFFCKYQIKSKCQCWSLKKG